MSLKQLRRGEERHGGRKILFEAEIMHGFSDVESCKEIVSIFDKGISDEHRP
jgi:hypothetical protein